MVGTFSDWIIALEQRGFKETARNLHTKKLQDYRRLKKSGLPIFDDLIVPYQQFNGENKRLMDFLARYNNLVVRAIPNTKSLPRRYKIGIHSFEECQDFLAQVIKGGDEKKYSVLITEHEPTNWAGIIISRPEDVLIEVAKSGLDELSHGSIIPSAGHFTFHHGNHFRSMGYYNADGSQRGLIWQALQYLRRDTQNDSDVFPAIDFMGGYFEFVVTEKTGRIKFLDFKVNEAYAK